MTTNDSDLSTRVWDGAAFTSFPDFDHDFPEQPKAVEYQANRTIESHPFIELMGTSISAIHLWAAQEYLISCIFARELASWLGTIDNCHVRATSMPVLSGEHGRVTKFGATRAHASLSRATVERLGLVISEVQPVPPTLDFLESMRQAAMHPMYGVGYFGVGNERLLVSEYSAVLRQVSRFGLEAIFEDFLNANIGEDTAHAELLDRAARGLASLGHSGSEYFTGAMAGVDSRITYYDGLLRHLDTEAVGRMEI